jgi:flagellin-like protein
MKLNELFADDDAVSPVIGVILMVAITVILAAVIGTFVLGLGSEVQETPQAQFTFEQGSAASGNDPVTITHSGGDPIDPTNMQVSGAGGVSPDCSSTGDWDGLNDESQINAGSSCEVTPSSSSGTIRITWQSDDGSTSDELATYDYSSS